jgi:hypothetical protein
VDFILLTMLQHPNQVDTLTVFESYQGELRCLIVHSQKINHCADWNEIRHGTG